MEEKRRAYTFVISSKESIHCMESGFGDSARGRLFGIGSLKVDIA